MQQQKLRSTINKTIRQIGYGHTEAVYQRAIASSLIQARVPVQTEVLIPFMCNDECVGVGRVDILTPTFLLELKVMSKSKKAIATATTQIKKYVYALKKNKLRSHLNNKTGSKKVVPVLVVIDPRKECCTTIFVKG